MTTTIRPAQADDLEATDALVVASINDLTQRHGFGAIAKASPPRLQRFSLADDPEGLWVAEQDGGLVGFGFSWVNDDLWFLAQLFVRPDVQTSGVGGALIAKALEHAKLRRVRARALITFAFNRASQALYMRHGLFPVTPLYVFSAARSQIAERGIRSPLRSEPLLLSAADAKLLRDIDAVTVGVSRHKHHSYMLGEGGLNGMTLWAGRECVGYAYIGPDGHIGPVAVSDARFIDDAFSAALVRASEQPVNQVSAFLPGSSPAVLQSALGFGMRIVLPMLLMADNLPGTWDRYLPRNPGLM